MGPSVSRGKLHYIWGPDCGSNAVACAMREEGERPGRFLSLADLVRLTLSTTQLTGLSSISPFRDLPLFLHFFAGGVLVGWQQTKTQIPRICLLAARRLVMTRETCYGFSDGAAGAEAGGAAGFSSPPRDFRSFTRSSTFFCAASTACCLVATADFSASTFAWPCWSFE